VTGALPQVVSADVAVFGAADMTGRTMVAVENPHVTSPGDLDTFMRLCLERPHPLMSHFATCDDTKARRMTDVISRRAFLRLPIYTGFYRKFGLESVMGILLNSHPTAFDGLTLNRGRRDFDERDRSILTLLQPRLVQAYRTARTIDRLQADLSLTLRVVKTSGFGLVVLSESRRVQLVNPHAAAWLTTYFGAARRGSRLPDSLDRWIRHQQNSAADPTRLPPPRAPFLVERDGSRLVVHLVAAATDSLLLLEEQSARPDLEPLGLSRRETEVLGWVAVGKTPKQVAAILGLSSRTVQAYLERLFGKLQVDTRAAAVARAYGGVRVAGDASPAQRFGPPRDPALDRSFVPS
jgi:DNA-binding CsgD family transcriptional regulator